MPDSPRNSRVPSAPTERKLAAIMFTDIVGYTALMAESEERGLRVRERHRSLVRPLVEQYHGDSIEVRGDESLSVFPTALDAVNCALAIEEQLRDDPELNLHLGIHLGDLVLQGGEVSGDGVNIASRICSLSEGGGLCVSGEVYRSIRNQAGIEAVPIGEHELKNVPEPVAIYAVSGRAAPPRPVSRTAPGTRLAVASSLRWAVPAFAVIAIGVGWWLYRPAAELPPIRSIAVLPLENLSGDPEQEYFADGMTEAVISEFAQIASLRVISRTSVMQYKGIRRHLPEIARELNVEGIIEGSALRVGDRVRITLQLLDARNDHHLWAQSYERDMRDVLALQGEIARTVAREVEAELTPKEQALLRTARSVDPEAHDAYLRGTLLLAEVTPPDLFRAIQYFEQAVKLDPDHAEAWVGLADAYRTLGWGLGSLPPAEARPKARTAVERALDLDDSLARAHASLGDLLAHYEWRWSEAAEELRRAVELSPGDPIVNNRYGLYLSAVGRHEEAIRFHQKAVDSDPASLHFRFDKALALYHARDYERSTEEVLQILEVNPDFPFALFLLAALHARLGRDEEVFDLWIAWHRIMGRDERWRREFERGYSEAGLPGAYRYWLDAETERARAEHVDPWILAVVSNQLGDTDSALIWLERAYDAGSPPLGVVGVDPGWDPLRSDPRFQDLLRRIGFPES
jgi:TolB-like protein/class 3 adenylate cyclase/Tfp pilus assembly protein PilF